MSHNISMVALILAAGSSSRLGQPKQLIEIEGIPLLQRIVSAFHQNESVHHVLVVTGANERVIRQRLGNLDTFDGVEWLSNPDWRMGMGHSLAHALNHVDQKYPQVRHAIVSVCDQPFLDSATIHRLTEMSSCHPDCIVSSAYSGTMGPPVVFPRRYFAELLNLSGDSGAKRIINKHMLDVVPVAFPRGAIDIDTVSDLNGI